MLMGSSSLPNRIEDVSCSECGNAVASCHHDKAQGKDKKHQAKALRTAPGIEDLGEREFDEAGNDGGYDASSGSERVQLEGARHIGSVNADGNFLDGLNDIEQPNAGLQSEYGLIEFWRCSQGVCQDQMCLAPHGGDGLNLLDTGLSILGDEVVDVVFLQGPVVGLGRLLGIGSGGDGCGLLDRLVSRSFPGKEAHDC